MRRRRRGRAPGGRAAGAVGEAVGAEVLGEQQGVRHLRAQPAEGDRGRDLGAAEERAVDVDGAEGAAADLREGDEVRRRRHEADDLVADGRPVGVADVAVHARVGREGALGRERWVREQRGAVAVELLEAGGRASAPACAETTAASAKRYEAPTCPVGATSPESRRGARRRARSSRWRRRGGASTRPEALTVRRGAGRQSRSAPAPAAAARRARPTPRAVRRLGDEALARGRRGRRRAVSASRTRPRQPAEKPGGLGRAADRGGGRGVELAERIVERGGLAAGPAEEAQRAGVARVHARVEAGDEAAGGERRAGASARRAVPGTPRRRASAKSERGDAAQGRSIGDALDAAHHDLTGVGARAAR